jgi:hypothetical protein
MLLARLAARGERPGNAPENLRITRDAYAWILS